MKIDMKHAAQKLLEWLGKNKYVLAVLLFGVFLLMLPHGEEKKAEEKSTETSEETEFSQAELESRLGDILSKIDGAGEVDVMLTFKSGAERVVASDTQTSETESGGEGNSEKSREESVTTVIVSTGSGVDEAVTLKYIYPEYQGALIVAQGAGSASVRLDIIEAVAAVTGLPTDSIKVVKMK
ncbi:MAG: stage III sporulation protein AG [Oscillospiraceae bacterium]